MAAKKEKQRHLGRGLQSLLGPINDTPNERVTSPVSAVVEHKTLQKRDLASMLSLSVEEISPNPYQPRTHWNDAELAELAESISANGIIQPIIVRPDGDKYQIIAGERRFRASQIAGLTEVPAVVKKATDEQMLEMALVENIHRSNLNPIERAKAYQNYVSSFSLTQSEAAKRLGEDRSVVANYMRLLDLPDEVKRMLVGGQLSMGHARAILALPGDDLRRKLANRAMAGRLSVREVERLVRKHTTGSEQASRKVPKEKAAHIRDLENKLTRRLGTRVAIDARSGGHRGKITIEFYSLDDFDRISEFMGLSTAEEV